MDHPLIGVDIFLPFPVVSGILYHTDVEDSLAINNRSSSFRKKISNSMAIRPIIDAILGVPTRCRRFRCCRWSLGRSARLYDRILHAFQFYKYWLIRPITYKPLSSPMTLRV